MVAIPSFECPHGDSSVCPLCQEIRQIWIESRTVDRPSRSAIPLDEALLGRPDPALARLEGREDQAARHTLRTTHLDTFPVQHSTRQDRRAVACDALRQLFPSDAAIHTLHRWGPMTDRQARVLEEVLFQWSDEEVWGDEPLCWTTRCERIGDQIGGCSRQTVSRELDEVIRHVTRCPDGGPRAKRGAYAVTRERGSRQREVWVTRVDCIGAWFRSSAELVTDEAPRRRVLRARPPSRDEVLQPIPTSVMRQELSALTAELLGQDPAPPSEHATTACDRLHNLRWARRRLQTARRTQQPRDVGDMAGLLVRGCRYCRSCHTPILAGCRIWGHLVTKRRLYCDDACQMKHERRNVAHGRKI